MNLISNLTTLIKRLKPRRYIRMRVELPAPIPPDFSPDEYSDKDLSRMSSDEIESKALAVYSVLTKNCNVTPKRLRGTISYVFDASLRYNRTIVIKCEIPEDAPTEHIRDVLVRKFNGNCTFFV